jgi:hypothetical protein
MAVFIGAVKRKKEKKYKISFLDENGYTIYRIVNREQLRLLTPIIDLTIEKEYN